MTWESSHQESEGHELRAEELRREGESERARDFFRKAAQAEQVALDDVDPQTEPQTFAMTAVNACSLWYEAGDFASARALARRVLKTPALDGYAPTELHRLLDQMDGASDTGAARHPKASWLRRPVLGYGLAVALLIALGCSLGWLYVHSRPASYATAVGETRTVMLADGSTVNLNTQSRLTWKESEHERRAWLSGEALFNVARDAARPFRVALERSEIEVLGTTFNVHVKADGEITLDVIAGRVAARGYARGATAPAWERTLGTGDQIVYNGVTILREQRRTDPTASPAWLEGRYFFDDETVAAVVDELNRYTNTRIILRDRTVAQTRISGVMTTRDSFRALKRLESLAPMKVTREGDAFVIEAK